MAHKHRTYNGKPFDMMALAAKHEGERAVSNVPRNARGDVIDGQTKWLFKLSKSTKNITVHLLLIQWK